MKKILIVNKSFETGGIQSALVNLANELQKYYQVDLFVYNPEGPMRARLHEGVNVLPTSWRIRALGMSLQNALKTRDVPLIVFRVFATIWSKLINNKLPIETAIRHHEKLAGYDLAIAYHQEQRKHSVVSGFSRVVSDYVDARHKIAWLHFDNASVDLDSEYNNLVYMGMDRVVCVSESLKDSFERRFPEFKGKTDFCYNCLNYPVIIEKSKEPQAVCFPEGKIICFSACRLAEVKAIVRAVKALSPVFKEHPEFMWYIAGNGPERGRIEEAIKETNLEQQIILLGNLSNPYPYMKNADLLMNVSYHEAAPMVFLEAKALGTPVFATKTSSAEELLREPACSFICENSEKGLYETFLEIADNPDKILAARTALKDYPMDNRQSLLKFAEWLSD